jgi:hypothetical protein
MEAPKFKAGDAVMLIPSRLQPTPREGFKIVRQLPRERGVNQYRIQSSKDGHERVVMEGQIT